ncbi:peptidylprolyl isomerase [Mycolicibacterium holsaticum]|uniref:peptidylprolyl isomerase n=1 Tax=Mycolicibacterium holsaticum TaxID=152142 RepID=UPI001C7CE35E|nr:peptidylprolyl isomerase [Mycolicibacterium holsaticum]MDA4109668.1 peptidyl-prolyl cis-trans isomerase [Mycolicibacterium holsaticum DSM 44478 = JCM 12374]QZA10602.1 peptidylprolyl isomerase [Mycolicibacterium holsaticum DSM 44478 = JCM 12374]UNC11894.1 peptidylprolyl isomerase [Mycolicibacterium holsaticum DSM 44478 = JCM 12374]
MPTNEQRRATAKRKLERQLERRAEKARKRRIYAIVGGSVAAVVVIAAVVATFVITNRDSDTDTASVADTTATPTTSTPAPTGQGGLPPFAAPAGLGENCQYPATAEPASKQADPPRSGKVPTDPAQISASMETNQGDIGLMLDNGKSPCTVNSFASLAQQGYFNDTVCHRLTTSDSLSVLQCGDPTGKGTGGPGYQFANEYPTNQYQPDDPKLMQPVTYPRGTLAMANAGANTNGSQFFLVYQDSQLPPNYTVFGTIDETGLATLDKIAEAGVAGGGEDGAPAQDVKVTSILLD